MKKRSLIFILCLFLGFTTFAQKRVTGVVYDTQGVPVPGVTIMEKGTSNGVVSDINGNFSLEVAGNSSVLVFSFVGMETQEVTVGAQTNFNITMKDLVSDLDEVIVIGYGVQKKKLNTGATVQVKGDDIQKLSTVSPMTALQGQTPGVSIIKTTGEPGAGFKVNIRGMGTMGNSQPLYVIDGVPGGNIDYLTPGDIESIDILKDAASAAIYGSRAANGVVLVTTKRGAAGGSGQVKANITYDAYYGVQNLYKKLPLANAQEYAILLNEARVNSEQPLLDFAGLVPDWDLIESGVWKGTNWMDEFTAKDAPIQSHAINIAGASEFSSYSLGLSYSSVDGIFGKPVASQFEQYSFRLNSDHTLIKSRSNKFDLLKVGETLRYSFNERHGIGTGNQYWNDIFSMTVASPFLPLWDYEKDDYHYAIPWNQQEANPIASMVYNRGLNGSKNHNLNGSIYVEIQPIEGLRFKSQFGYGMSAGSYRSYNPVYSLSATSFRDKDRVNQSMYVGASWMFENTVSYDFKVADTHAITALLGTSAEKSGLGESMSGENVDNIFEGYKYAYLRNTPVVNADGTTKVDGYPWGIHSLNSYFGRLSYNFMEKYMGTVILRADGSSNFKAGNRWGYFPSVSAGWVMTEESFMSGFSGTLDFLKLRASWGQNGNESISAFQYLATISFENVNYFFGPDKGAVSIGGYPDILPNPDVSWETSEQINIGFDARMFNSRLGIAFDYYIKTTKDWLVVAPALASLGTDAPYVNGGDIENKGIELGLTWNDRAGDFTYGVGINFAKNKNEVTRIDNTEGIIYGPGNVLGQGTDELYRVQVGYPIGYFRGYKTLGVFQNDAQIANYKNSAGQVIMPNAQPGDLIFNDTNDDGVISNDDKVMIGDPNPDFTLGINLNAAFKGFDFSLAANGAFGHQIARSWRRWADSPQNNYTTDVFGRWHGEGSSNKLPRLTYGSHINWQYVSDIFIEDGDYLRISNVTLGYDLKKAISAIPLAQFRVYFSAQNLYTFTNYSGMDPEVGTSSTDDNWAKGVDIGFYPSPRTYMVGVNIKF